jgi:hypothetical protein
MIITLYQAIFETKEKNTNAAQSGVNKGQPGV